MDLVLYQLAVLLQDEFNPFNHTYRYSHHFYPSTLATMIASLFSAAAFFATAAHAGWSISGYTGQQCTGEQLYHHENNGAVQTWCAILNHSPATSSVVINVDDDSDRSYLFELHNDDACVDLDFGHIERKF